MSMFYDSHSFMSKSGHVFCHRVQCFSWISFVSCLLFGLTLRETRSSSPDGDMAWNTFVCGSVRIGISAAVVCHVTAGSCRLPYGEISYPNLPSYRM